MWIREYKWLFMTATFVFIGLAFYKTCKDRKKTGPWGMRMLFATTALSIGLVAYVLIHK
jgi:hypothetical protein